LQIGVGPNDDSWIYGSYVCRATNFLGSNTTTVQLRQASMFTFKAATH